jgi:hypothetical protein
MFYMACNMLRWENTITITENKIMTATYGDRLISTQTGLKAVVRMRRPAERKTDIRLHCRQHVDGEVSRTVIGNDHFDRLS